LAYIGNIPAEKYSAFQKQDFTVTATTSYVLDNPVANANELALFINFVRQEPTTAYSASGTTLTLTSATSSSDDMYCVYLGKAVQTVNPPNSSVGTSQLVDGAVSSSKLSSGKSNMTNTPSFMAYLNGNQNVSDATYTKVNLNAEQFDTNSAFDSSTNYRFTVPSGQAGKYVISFYVEGYSSGAAQLRGVNSEIRKNGSKYHRLRMDFTNNEGNLFFNSASLIIDLAVGDYIELWGYVNGTSGQTMFLGDGDTQCFMSGFKIIE